MRFDVTDQTPAWLRHRWRADLLGIGFVVIAAGVAGYALRDKFPEVGQAIATIGWWRLLIAFALVLAGLYATAEVWRRCLSALGHPVPAAAAMAIFFPAQAGKYLPGSVWPLLAQARNARRYGVPASTALVSGTVFLAVHAVTSVLAAALLLVGDPGLLDRFGPTVAVAGLGLVLLHPKVLTAVVRRLPRRAETEPGGPPPAPAPVLGWSQVSLPLVWMAPAWICYGGAGALLAGPFGGSPVRLMVLCTGAFALGWLVGLLVVIAPAGVGAREAVLALVLTPTIGLPAATSVALLLRVCHTAADVGLADRKSVV